MRIRAKIDANLLVNALREKLEKIIDPQSSVYRQVAVELIPLIHDRVHIEGKDANGQAIGTYTNEYMKVRTGNFGNSGVIKRGKNKGKVKDGGVITRGDKKGQPRPQYHRTADPKKIYSLTRQMENDYAVIGLPNGWGIGFNNPFNADKARWNQERDQKPVFQLSDSELAYAGTRTQELITQELSR